MRTQVRVQGFLLLMVFFCSGIALAGGRESQVPSGNAVTQWSGVAIDVLPVDPGLLTDSRAFAILHAAIHDAVNGVERRYLPYTADLSAPGCIGGRRRCCRGSRRAGRNGAEPGGQGRNCVSVCVARRSRWTCKGRRHCARTAKCRCESCAPRGRRGRHRRQPGVRAEWSAGRLRFHAAVRPATAGARCIVSGLGQGHAVRHRARQSQAAWAAVADEPRIHARLPISQGNRQIEQPLSHG